MKSLGPASHQEVSQSSGDTATSHMKVVKRLVNKTGFSKGVMEIIASDLSTSLSRKWSRFFYWCRGRNISPCKATNLQITGLFLYLRRELKVSVLAVKGY